MSGVALDWSHAQPAHCPWRALRDKAALRSQSFPFIASLPRHGPNHIARMPSSRSLLLPSRSASQRKVPARVLRPSRIRPRSPPFSLPLPLRIPPRPLPRRLLPLAPPFPKLARDPLLQRVVRVRHAQALARGAQHVGAARGGLPAVGPQQRQADAAALVVGHVGVVDLGAEGEGGRLEGVGGREVEVEVEGAALESPRMVSRGGRAGGREERDGWSKARVGEGGEEQRRRTAKGVCSGPCMVMRHLCRSDSSGSDTVMPGIGLSWRSLSSCACVSGRPARRWRGCALGSTCLGDALRSRHDGSSGRQGGAA